MGQLRRKDTEGRPANGGQFAEQAHDHDDSVALSAEPDFAWPAVDGAGIEPALIDYGSNQICVCKNTNNGDGFVTTDARGVLHDDQHTAEGIICLVCGRFYRVNPSTEEAVEVVPTARFDVGTSAFGDAYDEYWERNFGV